MVVLSKMCVGNVHLYLGFSLDMNLCSVHFNRKKQTNRTKQVQTELEKFSFSLSYEIKAAVSSLTDHFLVTL